MLPEKEGDIRWVDGPHATDLGAAQPAVLQQLLRHAYGDAERQGCPRAVQALRQAIAVVIDD